MIDLVGEIGRCMGAIHIPTLVVSLRKFNSRKAFISIRGLGDFPITIEQYFIIASSLT